MPDFDPVEVFYRDYYSRVFNAEGFVGWSYRLTHRAVELDAPKVSGLRVLEIGAGTGEHLPFVDQSFDRYVMLDIASEPLNPPWRKDSRVEWVSADASSDALSHEQFDRVICMCVLHHVQDVPGALSNVKRWLAPGGTFSLFLPSDPGWMNRLNRYLFVSPRCTRLGFSQYPLVNAREHRNHYWGIRTELLNSFEGFKIKTRYWPFGIPAADLSLFSVWSISDQRHRSDAMES